MNTILAWLGSRLAMGVACMLAVALAWQTARIEGWPLTGGGFKAQVAALQARIAARDLADARAQAAALAARQKMADASRAVARDAVANDHVIQAQIQTVIREVPKRVDAKADSVCVLDWGAVRLLDAAASGADPGDIAAHIAPGQPDDAPSDVKLSAAVALLAADLGIARRNAGQLEGLQKAVSP